MIQNQKHSWLILAVVTLSFSLNLLIIKIAYSNRQNLLWVLIISLPVFIISVYQMWQSHQSRGRYLTTEPEFPLQQSHFLRLSHSIYPNRINLSDLSAQIGNIQCSKPYETCLLNIVPMDSTYAKWPLVHTSDVKKPENPGYQGKGNLVFYDLAAGGLVWQIGPNFQGCRTATGNFDRNLFKRVVCTPEVKMIEIRLTSRGHFTQKLGAAFDMAKLNDTKIARRIFQESNHTAFSKPEVLIHFIESLRELSGGKPIGIRLCLNDKKEFYQICHSIRKIEIIPDFVVVEGSSEKDNIVSSAHPFYTEMSLYDALLFVSQTLKVYSLDKDITVIAAGRIISGFDILKVLALGANVAWAEVADFKTAAVAENLPVTMSQYRKKNVRDFHFRLLKDTAQIMSLRGFKSIEDITLSNFLQTLDIEDFYGPGQSGNRILFPDSVSEKNSGGSKLFSSENGKTSRKIAMQ